MVEEVELQQLEPRTLQRHRVSAHAHKTCIYRICANSHETKISRHQIKCTQTQLFQVTYFAIQDGEYINTLSKFRA